MVVKRLRKGKTIRLVDRISDMPEHLQLRILSCLDIRHAIGTSMLSKSWVSLWNCIPVLNFSSNGFINLHVFDIFVFNVLCHRQSVKLNKLTFNRGGKWNDKLLEKVFDYAFSHGVEELEACINGIERWSISLHTSSDSLTSLKLQSNKTIAHCSVLKPRSGSFKNLTNLHLDRVYITDLDPFSRFPVLDKLRLVACFLETKGDVLNVHAPQLSEFSMVHYRQHIKRCEFTTPKLRCFEWRGSNFPQVKGGFPVLDTVVVDYHGYCFQKEHKMMFDDLLMMFDSFHNAKSLTVFSSVFHLLTLFPLTNEGSPFRDLKCLKLDFNCYRFRSKEWFLGRSRLFIELLKLIPDVKAYLLHKSQDAKFTVICMKPTVEMVLVLDS